MNHNFLSPSSPTIHDKWMVSTGLYYHSRVRSQKLGIVFPLSSNKPIVASHHTVRVLRIIKKPVVVVHIANHYTHVYRLGVMSHYSWFLVANVFNWETMYTVAKYRTALHPVVRSVVFDDSTDIAETLLSYQEDEFFFQDELAVPFGELFGDRLVI